MLGFFPILTDDDFDTALRHTQGFLHALYHMRIELEQTWGIERDQTSEALAALADPYRAWMLDLEEYADGDPTPHLSLPGLDFQVLTPPADCLAGDPHRYE